MFPSQLQLGRLGPASRRAPPPRTPARPPSARRPDLLVWAGVAGVTLLTGIKRRRRDVATARTLMGA